MEVEVHGNRGSGGYSFSGAADPVLVSKLAATFHLFYRTDFVALRQFLKKALHTAKVRNRRFIEKALKFLEADSVEVSGDLEEAERLRLKVHSQSERGKRGGTKAKSPEGRGRNVHGIIVAWDRLPSSEKRRGIYDALAKSLELDVSYVRRVLESAGRYKRVPSKKVAAKKLQAEDVHSKKMAKASADLAIGKRASFAARKSMIAHQRAAGRTPLVRINKKT